MQGGADDTYGPKWAKMWDKSKPTDTNPVGVIVPDNLRKEIRL